MIKPFLFIAVASFFALALGCGAQSKYGNFTNVDSSSLVNDAITVMLANYPPAQTRLNMIHTAHDTWGEKLVRTLRTHGYAVNEYSDAPPRKDKYAETGVQFAFILDEFKPEKEFNLTLFIGEEILSRSYALRGVDDSKVFVGLGQWTRRR